MKRIIAIGLLVLFSYSASAVDCEVIGHKSGKTYDIYGKLNHYTHIILPENLMPGTKSIVGNPELWRTDDAGPHIYIKPTSESPQGLETTISAVGESGASYDFKITRKSKLANTCYQVSTGILFNDQERKALSLQPKSNRQNDVNSELAQLYKEKYQEAQRSAVEDKKTAVLDALRKYRYQIYTRYDWKKPSKSNTRRQKGTKNFIGNGLVSDVYDDGRFTYIRVYNQNKGIMIVEAELEGQTELIEAKFDSLNRMYTIAGIYPEFRLRYGDSEVDISRNDNTTSGEY